MTPGIKRLVVLFVHFSIKKSTLLFMLFLCLFLFEVKSQIRTNVTGSWSYSIPSTNITEAGNDFTGTYTSRTNAAKVDIYQRRNWANFSGYDWRVDISKADIDWDNTLEIYARRTGSGIGYPFWFWLIFGAISGGTSYQQVTDIDQAFFNGTDSDLDVPIQYQVRGASLTLPAKTYSTTIVYTVTEL